MNTGADDDSLSTPTRALSASSPRPIPLAAIANMPAKASRAHPVIPFSSATVFLFQLKLDASAGTSEPPLPLWERVGMRGYRLSIGRNPSPGLRLTMQSDLSHKGRGGTEHEEQS